MAKSRYAEIADTLAGELSCCAAGTRVASEHEIAHRFRVGRAAARAAVQELESRLLVRRVQGAGTFVIRPIDYVISQRRAPSWHQTVRDAGGTPRSVVRDLRQTTLSATEAQWLERPVGSDVHLLVRQCYINDLLHSWSNEWIPTDVVDEMSPAVYTVESLDSILRQLGGVTPVRAWCRVSAAVPPALVADGLDIEASRPIWLVESISRDRRCGRPVMCSRTWSLPESARVIVEMDGAMDLDGATDLADEE